MIDGFDDKLVIAISSRAPFNLDECHAVYESGGEEANCRYQIDHEDEPLDHGIAVAGLRSIHAIGFSGYHETTFQRLTHGNTGPSDIRPSKESNKRCN